MLLTVEKVAVLTGVDMFAEVPTHVLAPLAAVFEEIDIAEGHELIRQGEIGDCLFVVVDGALAIEVDGQSVDQIGPGAVVGELALLDPEPRAATVVAAADTLLLRLDQAHFELFVTDHPEVSAGVTRYLVRFIRSKTRRDARNGV